MILADTTFLIDLQRSSRNPRHQAAAAWLSAHPEVEIALPVVVMGEFAEGFASLSHPVIEHYRSAHRLIKIDLKVARTYSRLSRKLREEGQSIGANDTWIAAIALAEQAPLLTRNVDHFQRVEGLEVRTY